MPDYFPANGHVLKTPFWSAQQKRAFDRSCDVPNFYLQHEPRCGKSMPVAATCDYQYGTPSSPLHITGAIVIAWPNGAHLGWVLDCFPETFTRPWKGFIWSTQRSGLVSYGKEWTAFLKWSRGFKVFTINAEALISQDCKVAIGQFLNACGRVMVVGDEISFMVDENSRRAKTMLNLSKAPHVIMRRALDGTPVGRMGPLDYFAEYGFLDFDILGYDNRTEFNAHYAEFKTFGRKPFWGAVSAIREKLLKENPVLDKTRAQELAIEKAKGAVIEEGGKKRKLRVQRDWWRAVAEDENGMPRFKNAEEMWKRIDPVTDRATFAECFPNAKRPVFAKRYFELSPEQRRVYDEIENEHGTVLSDGTEISITHHLSRILRLQQVASGFYPDPKRIRLHEACGGAGCDLCDDGTVELPGEVKVIGKTNPRLEAYADELKEGKPTIVWARFNYDVDECMRIAKELAFNPVQYDGRVSNADKLQNRLDFQAGKVNPIIAKPTSGSRGIPLHRARKHIMVSNIYSFRTRRQQEERSEHGSKAEEATTIVDLVGVGTVDETSILPALRQGMNVSTWLLRDAKRDWL